MKNLTLNFKLLNTSIFMIVNILVILNSYSQNTFNANGQSLTFSNSNEYHLNRNGNTTNGRSENDQTFYQNVITIGGTQIHCVITTFGLTSGTSYSTYDDNTYTNYFSPRFNFNNSSGQTAHFVFEFYRGGTYNSSNRTYTGGTSVTLQNLYINSYDIDGNDNSNSQQSVAFSEEVAYTTESNNLIVSNNTPTGFKQFRSQTTTNNNNIFDNQNRVRVEYEAVSRFELIIGGRNGAAHYYFDFSMGASWSSLLDLHTDELGVDNSAIVTGNNAVNFTNIGTTNVLSSSIVSYFDLEYNAGELLNGSNERLIINGASSGSSLAYNRTANHDFTLNSNNYRIFYNSATPSLLRFYKMNGTNTTTMTVAEALTLVNSFQYQNTASTPTGGDRVFDLTFRNTNLTSNVASFNASIPIILPINIISFKAEKSDENIELTWVVNQEVNFSHFEIMHSIDGKNYSKKGQITSNFGINEINSYQFLDQNASNGVNYYKLKIVDFDGSFSWSKIITIEISKKSSNEIRLYPNPSNSIVNVSFSNLVLENYQLEILDINGKVVLSESNTFSNSNTICIDINALDKGIYTLNVINNDKIECIKKFIKN